MKTIDAVDLFCGGGGTSSGLLKACEELGYKLNLLAINHWDIAIATHSQNHKYARHMCQSIDQVDPRKAVPSGKLGILVASPECTHHSIARGGKPCSDQSRASAWLVVRWAEALRIENILIENVKEFQSWGPLDKRGRPMKSMKGATFRAFINALESLNYKVDFRVLNAAYYGDPTTRERLFIVARRGRKSVVWPEPTHTPDGRETLFGKTQRWKTARDIIDWSIPGQSIFSRKKPLAKNTMNRIVAGMRKFCSKDLEPFLVMMYGTNDARSTDRPLPTITAGGGHVGLCKPFLVQYYGKGKAQGVDHPLPTQTTRDRMGLCEPFLVQFNNKCDAKSVDKPAPTLCTKEKLGLCEPFIVPQFSSSSPRSVDKPLGAITTTSRGVGLCTPFIIPTNHGKDNRSHSINKPMPTVTTVDAWGMVQPFILGQQSCSAARSVDQPIPTVAAAGAIALVAPELKNCLLDIHFRMLKPHELAAAMSFDKGYKFEGNREAQVKQIGNAVPVQLAKALCKTLLTEVKT